MSQPYELTAINEGTQTLTFRWKRSLASRYCMHTQVDAEWLLEHKERYDNEFEHHQ